MRIQIEPLLLATVALAGTAHALPGEDELCRRWQSFAASVEPGEVRSIEFHTSWGSNFANAPEPALFAAKCVSGGHAPAEAVCEHLLEHGAIEFAGRNAGQALGCLAPGTRLGPEVELAMGVFQVGFGTPERGSHITLEFKEDTESGGRVLRVSARGY